MTVTSLNAMTLTEARDLLDSIGYRQEWSFVELRAGVDRLPPDLRELFPAALEITAIAFRREADLLKAEIKRRGLVRPNG